MSKPVLEAPAYEYKHRTPVQIRFNDIDVLGHLNNSIYMQFMDLGKAAYFSGMLPEGFNWDNVGLVIANINIDFLAPSYLEDNLEVLTAVESISRKSLVLDQRVINSSTGQVKSAAKVTMVCVNPKTHRTEEISQEWRDRISAFEGREFPAPEGARK